MEHTTILKFGLLKSCDTGNWDDAAHAAYLRYADLEAKGDPLYREALCELIDALPERDRIFLWFDGEYVSKDEAKRYVINYDKP